MKKVFVHAKSSVPAIILIVALLIVQALCDISLPDYTAAIVNGIQPGINDTSYIVSAGIKMLGISLLSMVATVLVTLFSSKVAAFFSMSLRDSIFSKVISFSSGELDKFSTASLITRTTNDIQQIQILLTFALRIVVYAPLVAFWGATKVLTMNSQMGWIIIVAVGLILLLLGGLFSLAIPKFRVLQKLVDRLNLVSREILTGLMVIRAFGTEKQEEQRFDEASTQLMKVNLFVNRLMVFMMPTMMLIMNGIGILIVWFGASYADRGIMQVGDIMAFIQYTMQIIMAFVMISMVSVMLPRAIVSIKRISEVLNTDSSIQDCHNPKSVNVNQGVTVEFKNVTFKYPNAEEDVLSNISFKAKPGETTAIIGSTGSGKSTLLHLIPRFYEVTEGSILVNGTNIKDLTLKALRELMGFVPQKGVLFLGTIESNIKFSNPDMPDAQMELAAKIAQAKDFISDKDDRYDSEVSQGGTNVSGGQRQRLSIARAIAKKPPIYIFDDSFSALDYATDVKLRSALKEETSNSTVIIVAQRISTILHANKIIVLDEGKIVGTGTHEELLKSCEVYGQIASSQLSQGDLNKAV